MVSNEFLAKEILAHGAYLCVRRSNGGEVRSAGAAGIPALAERLGLRNEFGAGGTPSHGSIAFLRRHGGTPGDIADDDVLHADGVVHVVSKRSETVAEFCAETTRLLAPAARVRVLSGVVRPKNYTGAAMNNWAYERQVVQRPGPLMPNAFLVPLRQRSGGARTGWSATRTSCLATTTGGA